MSRLLSLLLLSSTLALPALASAQCPQTLQQLSQAVQLRQGLSHPERAQLVSACGETGASQLVDTLVANGACDQAAQIGRSFSSTLPGLEQALQRADSCMVDALDDALAGLEQRARQPAYAPVPDTVAPNEPMAASAWPEGEEVGERLSADANFGDGDLGASGTGYGGGGATRDREVAQRGALGLLGTRSGRPAGGADASSRVQDLFAEQQQGQSAARGRGAGSSAYDLRNAEAREELSRSNNRAPATTGVGDYRRSGGTEGSGLIPSDAPVVWEEVDFQIWFDFDSARLRPEAMATVAALGQRLRQLNTGTVLEVVGHTDSVGYDWYNQDLSWRRARSVEAALRRAGVGSVEVRGMGEAQPVATNATEWGRAQNRRVQFRFHTPRQQLMIAR